PACASNRPGSQIAASSVAGIDSRFLGRLSRRKMRVRNVIGGGSCATLSGIVTPKTAAMSRFKRSATLTSAIASGRDAALCRCHSRCAYAVAWRATSTSTSSASANALSRRRRSKRLHDAGVDEIVHGRNQRRIVGERRDDRRAAGILERNAARDERCGRDEQARARLLREAAVAQGAQTLRQRDEHMRSRLIRSALAHDDANFALGAREIELDRDEALSRARLQILEHALIAGVVGNDELKAGRSFDRLAGLVDRENASMVR